MRKLILLLFVICFCKHAKAQYTFEKVIDTLSNVSALCIQQTFDGGFVYCGKSYNNSNDVMIVKLDSSGAIAWSSIIDEPGAQGSTFIEQTPDSGYMVHAQFESSLYGKTWLLRLDSGGDTLWTKSFSVGLGATNSSQNNSMASIHDTIYGMIGYFLPQPATYSSAYFIATDQAGNVIASKTYNPSLFGSEFRAIEKTNDNGFIMTGLVGVTSSASDFYLVRTNAYGDTIWTKTYDKSQQDVGQAVVQTKDGGFAVAGYVYDGQEYIYLIRTDSFGDTLWTKKYNFYPGQVPFSLKQTNDDGFLIVGNALDNSFYRYTYAIKTDATGDTLWTRVFDISSNCLGFYTCQTSDNGYIIGGISIMFPAGAYIIKTDSMGIVNSTSGIFEEMSFLFFQCYPNPSNGIFSVYTKGNYENNSILEIYNLSGQCIYQCSITNNVINTVDIRFLQCGIYFATLKSKKFLKTFKLILDK